MLLKNKFIYIGMDTSLALNPQIERLNPQFIKVEFLEIPAKKKKKKI